MAIRRLATPTVIFDAHPCSVYPRDGTRGPPFVRLPCTRETSILLEKQIVMHVLKKSSMSLCFAALLAGGCATHPVATEPKPVDPHVGMPMAFSARVVGDKRPDFYSLKTMVESPQFHGKTGEELAHAFYKYFTSAKDGHAPVGNVMAAEGRPQVRDNLSDPLKLLNAYGWMTFATPDKVRVHGETRAHTMDFALRPGEKLIRSQRNEGRFPLLMSTQTGGAGARGTPYLSCGNGRWIYEPNLTAGYLDFAAGVRERIGLSQTAEGLVGGGQCVIPFVSPYPFVSHPEDAKDHTVYRDGAWITIRASGDVTLDISDPLGNWTSVPVAAGGVLEKIDISPLVEARYAFNLRLTLGTNTQVSLFRFEGWLLTAPITLPRLAEGINVMTLKGMDNYGMKTVPCESVADFRTTAAVALDQQAEIRNGVVRPGDQTWQVIVPKEAGPVQATFTFDAPAGEHFAWFYALASVAAGPTNTSLPKVKLEWCGAQKEFRLLAEAAIGTTPMSWDYNLDGEQILEQSSHAVQVRVTSDTPIRGLDFVGHLAMGASLYVRPEITHRWLENGAEHQFIAPQAADMYYFRCGPNPTGHIIEMELPSYRDLPSMGAGTP